MGELHEPEDGASWCDWSEGSMEHMLLAELEKRGAAWFAHPASFLTMG